LNEPAQFRIKISNSRHFSLERKQSDLISLDANSSAQINVLFIPSALGLADHFTMVSFANEKCGKINYELKGCGLEPLVQEPICIASEIGQTQIANVNFQNPTDSAIYCDLILVGN
jgi:hypothetical protein